MCVPAAIGDGACEAMCGEGACGEKNIGAVPGADGGAGYDDGRTLKCSSFGPWWASAAWWWASCEAARRDWRATAAREAWAALVALLRAANMVDWRRVDGERAARGCDDVGSFTCAAIRREPPTARSDSIRSALPGSRAALSKLGPPSFQPHHRRLPSTVIHTDAFQPAHSIPDRTGATLMDTTTEYRLMQPLALRTFYSLLPLIYPA